MKPLAVFSIQPSRLHKYVDCRQQARNLKKFSKFLSIDTYDRTRQALQYHILYLWVRIARVHLRKNSNYTIFQTEE